MTRVDIASSRPSPVTARGILSGTLSKRWSSNLLAASVKVGNYFDPLKFLGNSSVLGRMRQQEVRLALIAGVPPSGNVNLIPILNERGSKFFSGRSDQFLSTCFI